MVDTVGYYFQHPFPPLSLLGTFTIEAAKANTSLASLKAKHVTYFQLMKPGSGEVGLAREP